MANEGSDMNKPTWLQNNVNLGNIITLVAMLCAGAFGYGQLNSKIENMEQYRQERTRQTDAKFDGITLLMKDLPSLAYRVTATEEALKATNQRVDLSLQNISARLAEINQALGALDTKVAVLTQRIEMQTPQRRADALRPPG